jgi:hypothetical protein
MMPGESNGVLMLSWRWWALSASLAFPVVLIVRRFLLAESWGFSVRGAIDAVIVVGLIGGIDWVRDALAHGRGNSR